MKIYDCVLRLSGSVRNEVPKIGVSAPEVMLLQSIHGDDAVTRLQPRKMDKRSHLGEYDRLVDAYGEAAVKKLFVSRFTKLPTTLSRDAEKALSGARPAPVAADEPDAVPDVDTDDDDEVEMAGAAA